MSDKFVPTFSQVSVNQKPDTMTFEATILQLPKTGKCARRINATFQMSGDQPMTKYTELLNEILENMGYKNAAILEQTTSPLVRCNGTIYRMVVKVVSYGKVGETEPDTRDIANDYLKQHGLL